MKSRSFLDLNKHDSVLKKFVAKTGIGGNAECYLYIQLALFSVVGRIGRPKHWNDVVFFEIALAGLIGEVEFCKNQPYVPRVTCWGDLDAHSDVVGRAGKWLSYNASWLDQEQAEDELHFLYDALGPVRTLPRYQNKKEEP